MDRWDVVALAGLALMAAGLYFIYWPLALLVPGAALLLLAIFGAKRS